MPIRRMSDPYDALADAVGLLVGILLYGLLLRYGRVKSTQSSTASAPRES